ncbi:sensor histidine kinase [Paenibacillus xanthanilyticus]|uniref:histidine kinase n=1 Tax=Paenibacillus xanthanilyticus TaxID=1783531 RepID=A0ABV8JZY6_9BACL
MGKLARNGKLSLMQMVGRMSIQLKLILSFICIILIPIILVSWYLFNDAYRKTIEDLKRTNQFMLEVEKSSVAGNVALMERTAQLAITNSTIKEYLGAAEELETGDLFEFKMEAFANFQQFLFNNPSIAAIRLYTENPHVMEMYPVIFQERRIKDKPWYDEVIGRNQMVWWDISSSPKEVVNDVTGGTQNGLYVSLLRETNYEDGRHNGVLEVKMEAGTFFAKTFSSMQDSHSQMIVVNREGRAYTNERALIFRELPLNEILRQFQLRASDVPDSFSFTYKGHPFLCIPAQLEGLDSYLLNVVSLKEPLEQVNQNRNTIIFATLFLIVLLSISSYVMHSLILKKLTILRESMKQVRKGNFNVDIAITSMDEVGELAYHFRQMLKKMNELIVEAVGRQAATKEAELNSLKNQIDAHFLYNTLENLKMMAEIEGQYAISDSLTSLGGMMRYNLQWTTNHVRLKDELTHIQNYIAIMNIRYDNHLELHIDVPPAYMDQEVLKMSLQPVVENAVKHGMGARHASREKLAITIKAYQLNDCLAIEVSDNGDGIEEGKLREVNLMIRLEDGEYRQLRSASARGEREGSGIGLRNVDQRIVMNYGKPHGIRVESVQGSYTRVTLTLPYLILTGGATAHAQAIDRG